MKTAENFPSELESLLIKLEEEDGGMVVSSLEYKDRDLEIYIKVSFPDFEIPYQNWRIRAINIEKERFVRTWETNLQLFEEHPLLLEFHDDPSELYYKGKALNPEKLVFDLFQMFTEKEWKDLKFCLGINTPEGFSQICNQEAGLFARGPKSILNKYADLLHESGIQTNMLDHVRRNQKKLMLLILGESYFIAEEFIFESLNQ